MRRPLRILLSSRLSPYGSGSVDVLMHSKILLYLKSSSIAGSGLRPRDGSSSYEYPTAGPIVHRTGLMIRTGVHCFRPRHRTQDLLIL